MLMAVTPHLPLASCQHADMFKEVQRGFLNSNCVRHSMLIAQKYKIWGFLVPCHGGENL